MAWNMNIFPAPPFLVAPVVRWIGRWVKNWSWWPLHGLTKHPIIRTKSEASLQSMASDSTNRELRDIFVGCWTKNRGKTHQIIHFNRVFHYKPSILGYPYFWKHPYFVGFLSRFKSEKDWNAMVMLCLWKAFQVCVFGKDILKDVHFPISWSKCESWNWNPKT